MTRELIAGDPSESETLAAFDAFHRAFAPRTARVPHYPVMGERVIHTPTGRAGFCHGSGHSHDPAMPYHLIDGVKVPQGIPLIQIDGTDRPQPISARYLRPESDPTESE